MKTNTELPIIENAIIDVYPADIERIEYNYINSLPDPDSIYNVNAFIGLLFLLHRELIKPALLNAKHKQTGCNGYDIKALDSIFYNIFIPLIAKYRITPTIGLFYYLTGLDSSMISKWKCNDTNNIYIDNNSNNVNDNNDIDDNSYINKHLYYEKWNSYIENWLLQNTVSNNSIGSMFALKAVYGYSDTQTIKIESNNEAPKVGINQLATIASIPLPDTQTDTE